MLSLALVLALIILSMDISLPSGIAGGVPYVGVVLLGLWFPNHFQIILITLTAVMLTVLGYYLSPEDSISWVVITNRGFAVFAILAAGFILYVAKPKNTNPIGGLVDVENVVPMETWSPIKIMGSRSIGVFLLILLSVLGLTHYLSKETQKSISVIVQSERILIALGQTLSL
ncbi:MAG: hypothetical protein V7750_17150, partial [Sneathiella sp.]